MDENRKGLGLLNVLLIGIILILGMFLIVESLFIVAEGHFLDFTPSLSSKVAVIYVEGEMVTDGSPGAGYVGSGDVMEELREAQADSSVKAIVLRINSPGGSPVAAQDIFGQIQKTKQVKPVVVSMGDMATSAAYYISAPCDLIFAAPDSWTGSIGVIWPLQNSSAHYEKEGIQFYVAKSGGFKDIGADWRGLTEEEKSYVDGLVDETYQRFVDAVASSRNLSRAKVLDLSDGRVFTGVRAKELGLIDEIGDMYDAIDAAKRLANLGSSAEVTYIDGGSLAAATVAGSQSNVTRTAGHYQPFYSPYGWMYF